MSKIIMYAGLIISMWFSGNVFAAKTPDGEKSITTIGELACASGEQPRYDGVNWRCDNSLSVIEVQNLDNRLGVVEGQSQELDGRIGVIEGHNLDTRTSTLEGQDLDNRVTTAQIIADEALFIATDAHLMAFESYWQLDALWWYWDETSTRLFTLESQDLDTRLDIVEDLDLESRLSNLESYSSGYSGVVTVSAVGPTPLDNGLSLIAAVQSVASENPPPSATNPYVIFVYPGHYDLDGSSITLPNNVSIKGFDRDNTVLYSTNRVMNVVSGSIESLSIISPQDTAQADAVYVGNTAVFNDVYIEGRWGIRHGEVEMFNSSINAYFKCFTIVDSLVFDSSTCEGSTFIEVHGGDFRVKNSEVDGTWLIYNGTTTNIDVRNTKATGRITPANVNPLPTQDISLNITNSEVNVLTVGFSTSTVSVLFSKISSLEQTDGHLFMSHSIIGSLEAPAGSGNFVSSQLGSPTIIGGSITCPFSYDDSYQPLSGVAC